MAAVLRRLSNGFKVLVLALLVVSAAPIPVYAQKEADVQAIGNFLSVARIFKNAGDGRREDDGNEASIPLLDKAAGAYDLALKAAEKSLGPDHLACSDVCSELAEMYVRAGFYKQAEPLLIRALKIRQPQLPEDHIALSINWNNLGTIYAAKRDYAKAEGYFKHALRIREAKQKNQLIAETLLDLGDLYEQQAQYAIAASHFARCVKAYEEIGTKDLPFAEALNRLGKVHKHLGQFAQAVPIYERALTMLVELKGRESVKTAIILYNLSESKLHLGAYAEAEKLGQEALAIRKAKLGDKSVVVGDSLHNLAGIYQKMHRYPEAQAAYQESVRITEAALGPDSAVLAATLNGLAALYEDLSQYEQAESLYLRSLRISETKSGADHPSVAQVLNNLGHLETHRSRFAAAENYYQRAWAIQEKKLGPNHPILAETLNNLAVLYAMLGQYDKAEPLYQRSLKIQVASYGVEHPKVAVTINNVGALYASRGQKQAAGDYLQRSLEIREKLLGKEHGDVALALSNLGAFHNDNKQYAEAEPLLRRSIAINEKLFGPAHPQLAQTVNNLGFTNLRLNRPDEAEKLFERSVKVLELVANPDAAMAGSNLAALLALRDRWPEAADATDKAARAMRQHVINVLPILTEQEQLTFLRRKHEVFFVSSLSLGLARKEDEKIVAQSASWLANGKGVSHQALSERALLARDSRDPSLAPVLDELTILRRKMAALALNPPAQQAGTLKQQLAQLAGREQALATRLAQSGARPASANQWVELDDVRQGIPKEAVLIDFARFEVNNLQAKADDPSWLPAHYAAWIVPPQGSGAVRLIDLGDAEAIEAAVKTARDALKTALEEIKNQGELEAEQKLRAALEPLTKLVLQPLLPHIEAQQRWILSPDAALWVVPWAALPMPDDTYAIEKHPLSYVVSARDLVDSPAVGQAAPPLIFADPAYDRSPSKSGGAAGATPASRNVAGSRTLPKVQPLPATAIEARMIQPHLQSYVKADVKIIEAAEAHEQAVKAVHSPRVLVLSTHGFFLEDQVTTAAAASANSSQQALLTNEGKLVENPLLRCGLLFAGCNDRTPTTAEDGVLTGLEIVGIDMKGTELVVLSACETGLGEVRTGEGVAGLRQAFQIAGADAVVASLWQVPDRETARLMSGFFTAIAEGKPKAEALRQAQLKLIADRRDKQGAAHPFYWAAFTLTGIADFLPVTQTPAKPLTANELVERALNRETKAAFDLAIVDLTEALKLEPESVLALFHRGRLNFRTGRAEKAIEDFTETLRLKPNLLGALVLRSDLYRGRNELDKALADAEEAVKAHGQSALGYGARAAVYQTRKETDKAIADFTKAVELDPKSRFSWNGRADAYRGLKQFAKAAEDYTKLLEIVPNDANTYNKRGLSYAELKDYDKAIADQTEAIRLNPKFSYAFASRGSAWESKGDLDKAIADFSEAIRNSAQYTYAFSRRGFAYRDQRKYDLALADFTEAIKLSPKSHSHFGSRGFTYEKLGDMERALADYNQAIALNEKYDWGLGRRAGVYLRQGDRDKAIADLTRAKEVEPSEITYPERLALLKLQAGDIAGYRADCQALVDKFKTSKNPGDWNSAAWLCAIAPNALDDLQVAISLAAQAAERKPPQYTHLGTYGAILYRGGKFDEAVKVLTESIALEGKGGMAEDQMFLAMAHQRREEKEMARAVLGKVTKWLDENLVNKPANPEIAWSRRIELDLLRKEAEELVR